MLSSRATCRSPRTIWSAGGHPRAGRPERLYLDVPGIWVGTLRRGHRGRDGLLSAGPTRPEHLGIAPVSQIDPRALLDHRVFTLPSPARIVIDVYGDRKPARDADDRGGRPPQELRRVNTIVVDPGHGGRDPGATGVGGLAEDVTSTARQLRSDSRSG
ncbi:MAG: hypothetical protein R3E53_08585 [Myxococcota bacterium]